MLCSSALEESQGELIVVAACCATHPVFTSRVLLTESLKWEREPTLSSEIKSINGPHFSNSAFSAV